MRLGQGAVRDGGYQNPNLLSSTFEAVIGAYYLDNDQNIEVLRLLVEQLFDSVPKEVMVIRSSIDSKNKFQKLIQANGATTPPKYVTEKSGGTDHAPEFVSRVYVDSKLYGESKGDSKKAAEKQAAEDALSKSKVVSCSPTKARSNPLKAGRSPLMVALPSSSPTPPGS